MAVGLRSPSSLLVISWDVTQLLEATLRFSPCGPLHRQFTKWQCAFSRPEGKFPSPLYKDSVSLFHQLPSEECVLRREGSTVPKSQGTGASRIVHWI